MHVEVERAPETQVPPPAPKPPRLWPMVLLFILYWAVAVATVTLELPTAARFFPRVIASCLVVLIFPIWWWANRRIPLRDRAFGFLAAVVVGTVGALLCHPSAGGLFGLLLGPLPLVLTAWLLWMVLSKRASARVQRAGLVVTLCLVWGLLTLVRVNGLNGNQMAELHWRWTPSAEELFLAEKAQESGQSQEVTSDAPAPSVVTPVSGDWPGFRGPDRDGAVRGLTIATDWKANPPRLAWRRRVGPAWSSVAVVGGRLFTQEQRGEKEAVICYDAGTGKELWSHEDAFRFWETVSGAGPRATPTFADGRVYALGATGILNCLDAATGKRHWSRDLAADADAKAPTWGFCSSPLVVDGLVVVYAGGDGERSLLAYRADSGALAWTAAAGQSSYASPQPAKLAGTPQVLLLSDRGLTAVAPDTGAVLWEHAVPLPGAPRTLQPHVLGENQVLMASETDLGVALLDLTRDGQTWTATQLWASKRMKPAFNDFVVHDGHVYGFDGRFFCCLDLRTGERRWKDGRYGNGQALLLADQGLLLVISETGDALLLAATPERHQELGRFHALNGKTWNHPVIAQGRLYVRNAEEMACYELSSP